MPASATPSNPPRKAPPSPPPTSEPPSCASSAPATWPPHEFRAGTFVPLPPSAVAADAIPRLWYFTTPVGRALLDAGEAFFDTPSR